MAKAAEEPIFRNVNYTLSAHGANTGTFFRLPPNTRIFIPSINDSVYASVDAECAFARLNLATIDPICSNIDSILKEYFQSQTKELRQEFSYKIYDTKFGITECPNITYSAEIDRFVTGIAECPAIVKQTYLKNYTSHTTGEFRQAGDTITIDDADEKIKQFNSSFKTYRFRHIEEMLNEPETNPRGKLKKSIIAHLLFPYTKRINRGASVGIELPDYITYYDSSRFTTIEHLRHNMRKSELQQLELSGIIYFYRESIDNDPAFGPNTVITFITDACNRIPPGLEVAYKAQDKGMSYDEFIHKSQFEGLSPDISEEIALQRKQYIPVILIAKDLNTFFEENKGRSKSVDEINNFFQTLLVKVGIVDQTGKIDLHKIDFINKLRGKISDDIIKRLELYVQQNLRGGSIKNKYYLKYLKYKNKYLKVQK